MHYVFGVQITTNMSHEPQIPNLGKINPEEIIRQFNNNRLQIFVGLGIAAVALMGLTSFYTVQPDERAVLMRFGRYVTTAQPGLNFKFPFGIDSYIKITTRVEQENFGIGGAMASGAMGAGNPLGTASSNRDPSSESLMLTGDLKVAEVRWSVQYQVADPRQFVFSSSNPQKIIRDISVGTMRQVVGDKGVYEVLTVGRERIAGEAKALTQKVLDEKYNMGVQIVAVNLQSVSPPAPVSPSFNDVNAAIQDKDQAVNRAESEYNRVIPEARGKAEQELLSADGYAFEVINRARGDGDRLAKVIAQYEKAPEVTKSRLYLEMAETLMARMESVSIIDPNLKGVLPVFNENKIKPETVSAVLSDGRQDGKDRASLAR